MPATTARLPNPLRDNSLIRSPYLIFLGRACFHTRPLAKLVATLLPTILHDSRSLSHHKENSSKSDVKLRAKCECDILTGDLSTAATLIANIALKTRNFLEWDAQTERFTNNAAASQWLPYKYRAAYKL
jgi:hypothetical protein